MMGADPWAIVYLYVSLKTETPKIKKETVQNAHSILYI